MRIGKHEVTLSLLLHVVVFSCVAFGIWNYYKNHRAGWLEGRVRDKIYLSISEGSKESLEQGKVYCEELLAVVPGSADAQLFLANILFAQGLYPDALSAFKKVTKKKGISAKKMALAWTGCASSAYEWQKGKRLKKAGREAKAYYEKALKKDKDCPDAKIGLAILLLLKNTDASGSQAKDLLVDVFSGKRAPGRQASAQGYNALGVIESKQRQSAKADHYFLAAKGERPTWKQPELNRRWAAFDAFNNPNLDLKAREKLFKAYERRIRIFGDRQPMALNAMAQGFWHSRKQSTEGDFLKSAYPKALKILQKTMVRYPRHPQTYMNLAGIYDHRIFGSPGVEPSDALWEKLGEDLRRLGVRGLGRGNPWRGEPGRKLTEREKDLIRNIRSLAQQKLNTLTSLLLKVKKLTPEYRWLIELHRFEVEELRYVTAARKGEGDVALAGMLKSANLLVELKPDSPEGWRRRTQIMLYKKDYEKALAYGKEAQAKAANDKGLEALIAQLERKPTFFDTRPVNGRGFGVWPLAGVSTRIQSAPGPLKWRMRYGGDPIISFSSGSQILYILKKAQLGNGAHRILVEVADALGNSSATEWNYVLDKEPPVLSILPEKHVKGPRPRWTVSIIDKGVGVDNKSLAVNFQSVSSGATAIREPVILNGRYKRDFPNIKVTMGMEVPVHQFLLSVSKDIKPGVYKWSFSFADRKGNRKKVVKNLIVE